MAAAQPALNARRCRNSRRLDSAAAKAGHRDIRRSAYVSSVSDGAANQVGSAYLEGRSRGWIHHTLKCLGS